MRRLAIGLVLFSASTVTSCAFLLDTDELKEGSGEEPTAEPIPLSDLPAALARGTCRMLERCTGPAIDFYFPEEDCTTIQTKTLEDRLFGLIQMSIETGRVTYSPELAGACAEAFETLPCPDIDRWPEVCQEALRGQVAVDGACGNNMDCEPGAYCDVSANACPGVCVPQLPLGGTCLLGGFANDEACEGGLNCFQGVCTAPRAAGEPCLGNDAPECELGLLCLNSEESSGTCNPIEDLFRSLEGQSCNFKLGPLCEQGLHCAVTSSETGRCEPSAFPGGDCNLALPDECPAGEFCDVGSSGGTAGVCTALPGANEDCHDDPYELNPPCRPYHRCIGATCLPLRRLDEVCVSNEQCYSGFCETSSETCKTLGCVF